MSSDDEDDVIEAFFSGKMPCKKRKVINLETNTSSASTVSLKFDFLMFQH
jgi:hypothetical protein